MKHPVFSASFQSVVRAGSLDRGGFPATLYKKPRFKSKHQTTFSYSFRSNNSLAESRLVSACQKAGVVRCALQGRLGDRIFAGPKVLIQGEPFGTFTTVDGRNPFRTTLKQWLKPLFVGIYKGIIIPGIFEWCRISSIHSRCSSREVRISWYPLFSFWSILAG